MVTFLINFWYQFEPMLKGWTMHLSSAPPSIVFLKYPRGSPELK